MNECLEMMQEMALLVAIQGEQLDNIESTIDQTGSYMTNAEEKLVQAKGHHKSAKKVRAEPHRKCAASSCCC